MFNSNLWWPREQNDLYSDTLLIINPDKRKAWTHPSQKKTLQFYKISNRMKLFAMHPSIIPSNMFNSNLWWPREQDKLLSGTTLIYKRACLILYWGNKGYCLHARSLPWCPWNATVEVYNFLIEFSSPWRKWCPMPFQKPSKQDWQGKERTHPSQKRKKKWNGNPEQSVRLY